MNEHWGPPAAVLLPKKEVPRENSLSSTVSSEMMAIDNMAILADYF